MESIGEALIVDSVSTNIVDEFEDGRVMVERVSAALVTVEVVVGMYDVEKGLTSS
jgi:hypothetical protein